MSRRGPGQRWVGTVAVLLVANVAGLLFARRNTPLPGEIRFSRWLGGGPGASTAREWGDWLTDRTAPMLFALVVLAAVIRWRLRGAVVIGAAAVSTVLVRWADLGPRSRPSLDGEWGEPVPGWGGYPSGHIVFVGVALGALVLLSWSTPTGRSPGPGRTAGQWALALTALVAAVVTAWSRIAALRHWAFDSIGGFLVAGLILALLVPLARWNPEDHSAMIDRSGA